MKRVLYDVPRFSTFLHREARDLRLAGPDDTAAEKFADELFERLYTGGDMLALPEGERDKKLAGWAERFHKQATEVPAFKRFAREVQGDVLASAIAVESLTASLKPEQEAEKPKPPPQKPGQPGGQPGNGAGAALARAQAKSPDETMRRAVLAATARAERAVDEAREAFEGLSGVGGLMPGNEAGEHMGSIDVDQVKRLIRSLKAQPQLKRIADLAGKMKRIAATKRRTKVVHGADEVTDVEVGADLGRLLPSEAVKLMHPALKMVLMRDLTERNALQYRLEGRDTKGKGPLVVLTDKSGSMFGNRDVWATAVALALLSEAQREGRTFALIPFDHRVMNTYVVKRGETLPEQALFVPADGGTDINAAMVAGLGVIEQEPGLKKADIVLITDGGSSAYGVEPLREKAKALNVNVIGISIGEPKTALAAWADEAYEILRTDTLEDVPAGALFGAAEEA